MGTALLVALETKGVKKCGMTGVFFYFELAYFFSADGEVWLITDMICCFVGKVCG